MYLGDFPVNGKVSFLWNTNGQDGASITRSTDGTLKIFKTNATAATWATERSSLNGVTQLEDFDQTGIHSVYIDLSDNTDSGFYAAGNEYQVAITGATIDTKTVSAVLACFSIERASCAKALIGAPVAIDSGTATIAGMLTKLADDNGGATFDATNDSLNKVKAAIGTPANLGGGTATLAGNLVDIEAQTDDIGAAGAGLSAIPWNAAWDAEVQSEVDDALVAQRLDELLNADSDIDGAAPPTVGSVFHELMSKTAGSFTFDQTTDSNEAIRDKLTDIETDTAEIGTAGAGLTNINLPDQTMNITGDITGNLSGSVGSVTGAVGSVGAGGIANTTFAAGAIDAAAIANGAIDAATFAAGAIDAAAIATGAIDADALAADAVTEIWAKAMTELAAVPGVTDSVLSALTWVFAVARDKITQTATTSTLFKDDGTTPLATSTVSDDGVTFTRGEWG